MEPKHKKGTVLPCLLLTGLLLSLSRPAVAQVTVEIVNDSGVPDGNVFIKVPGKLWGPGFPAPITPTNLFVNISDSNPQYPTSLPLSFLLTNSSATLYSNVSTITGRTNTVYSFQADYIQSGAVYFTYDKPFTFTNGLQPNPVPDSPGNAYRYEFSEFSIEDSAPGGNSVDVTFVDKFGIPVQAEWFSGANSGLVAGSYVYTSTRTLVEQFNIAGLSNAVFSLTPNNITPGWQYVNSQSYSNFARILAPQKVSTTTSVAPYPDVSGYLNSLCGTNNSFQLNGPKPQGGVFFLGYNVTMSTNAYGWLVTMAYSGTTPPYRALSFTNCAQYTNTLTFTISNTVASQYIYGSPVGANYYYTNGVLVTNTSGTNSAAELWMIGDVLSAINFGFWNGQYGTNAGVWYSPVEWISWPFGSARNPNDGYYNTYSALMYNAADPYGYAFSERITPDVILTPTNGDRIRFTILPDNRLDSPAVTPPGSNDVTSSTITLNWLPVSGAAGYQVNVLRPYNLPPISLPAGTTSYTLTNLLAGNAYIMSVQATGTSNGNPVLTPARAVSGTTSGATVTNSGNLTLVQVGFGVADPLYQLSRVYINGIEQIYFSSNDQWNSPDQQVPARWIASPGTNQVLVTAYNTNNQVVFNDWLSFYLSPLSSSNTTAITNVYLGGQVIAQPPPNISGFPNGGNAASFPVATSGAPSVVLGLTLVPAETHKFSPVVNPAYVAPTNPASGVTITGVKMLINGSFQFGYTNTTSNSFTVYASTNLSNWLSIGTASLISPNVYQFTDPNATNYQRRYYRLQSP